MPQESTRGGREKDLQGIARLSPVSVRARAVIPRDGGIVVSRERRHGRPMITLPGGRVAAGEGAAAAALREVQEETGLEIKLGPLLYVAEVIGSVRRQDLNLIFLARVVGEPRQPPDVVHADEADVELLPPILDRIRRDQARGWEETGVWLGNVWRGDLGR